MLRSTMRQLAGAKKRSARKPTFRPHFEALERRDLMSALAGLPTVPVTGLGVAKGYAPPSPTAAGLALINELPNTPVRSRRPGGLPARRLRLAQRHAGHPEQRDGRLYLGHAG